MIWLNNTGCTKFSTIISLCNVWMLWICVNNLFKTHRYHTDTPTHPTPKPHYTPLKEHFTVFFLNIYNLLSKSGRPRVLKLGFASSSFFALMLDLSQHQQPSLCQTGLQGWLIKNNMCWETPQEQQIINVTSVCIQWKTAFVFNCFDSSLREIGRGQGNRLDLIYDS